MNILHTNFHQGWGGQSNRILVVCRGLVRKGHKVIIAAPAGSELAQRAAKEGIATWNGASFMRGFEPVSTLRDAIRLRGLCRREKIEVVHTHGSQDSWAVALALQMFHPRPLLIRTKHNIFPIKDHMLNRWLYTKATNGMVCISRPIRDYCESKCHIRRENIELIHSAVNADLLGDGDGKKIRGEMNLQSHFVVGITGRLRREKGHEFLFQAVKDLWNEIPNLVLLVVGSGSLKDELHDYARQLGIESRVLFTGFRKDIPDILAALDVFALPSISEGLGTAVLEAAAAGVPIVASAVGGITDIIEDKKNGLLVPPGQAGALAHAIFTLYKNRAKGQEYARLALQKVRAHFTEQMLVDRTEAFYKRMLARHT